METEKDTVSSTCLPTAQSLPIRPAKTSARPAPEQLMQLYTVSAWQESLLSAATPHSFRRLDRLGLGGVLMESGQTQLRRNEMAKTSLVGSAGITTIAVLCMLLAEPVAGQEKRGVIPHAPLLKIVLPDTVFERSYWIVTHLDMRELSRVRAMSEFILAEVGAQKSIFRRRKGIQ